MCDIILHFDLSNIERHQRANILLAIAVADKNEILVRHHLLHGKKICENILKILFGKNLKTMYLCAYSPLGW